VLAKIRFQNQNSLMAKSISASKTKSASISGSAPEAEAKSASGTRFKAESKSKSGSEVKAKTKSVSASKTNSKSASMNTVTVTVKDIVYEKVDWRSFQPGPVVGVDEVGRGCLAGPVYAAAACLRSDEWVDALTDSKLLSEKRREELAPKILEHHWVGIGFATVEEIDAINIFQASLLAMKRAVENLEIIIKQKTGHLLVDGNFKVPGLECQQTTLVKGDLRCTSISAASIVAKVTRDRLMKELAEKYPVYGFENHKGYAAPTHKKAIEEAGPCIHHRRTFAGVKEHIARLVL